MTRLIIIYFIIFLFQGINSEAEKFRPFVLTHLGKIEGYVGLTINMNPYFKFEGVPYAKPPIGHLRFEPPQDPEPWTGIWKANIMTTCMQYDHYAQDFKKNYIVHGDEDCLHVNIYTHSTSSSANLDVLVHIHGGAFMFGRGGNYGPEIIMDRNIVFVNFNYRLGPLGFLSTEDDIMPGNIGLHDQIKALKWIKENIKLFGGNPDSITIHGLSAGGASVQLHYLMPASRGLFKGGISQSGCVLNPWVLVENIKEKTKKVADLVGCPTESSEEIKKCLKSKPASHIAYAVREFQPFLYNPFSPFGVVPDGLWAENPVLPDHPYKLLKEGKVYDVPWLISYVSAEGLYPGADFWNDDHHLTDIDTRWNDIVPFVLHYNDSASVVLRNDVSQKIRQKYLSERPVNRDTYSTLIEIISDRLFIADLETAARLHSASVKSDVYAYTFDYRGATSKSNSRTKSTENLGVAHGDDTVYVLHYGDLNTTSTEEDRAMSEILLDMYMGFMQTGVPKINAQWQPLGKTMNEPYRQLKIAGPGDYRMELNKEIGRRSFWQSLPLKENDRFDIEPLKDEL